MHLPQPVTTDNPALLSAETLIHGFRIKRLLGEGSMGQVYLAQDEVLGRLVALKLIRPNVLRPGSEARLVEEARTTAQFNHPHIVTVHAAGEYQGRPFLALEYLDGESLRQRMTRQRPTLAESLQIVRAIAEAIAEAHRRGVVHADLKPENVLLPRDGRVRVVDFGLARHVGGDPTATSGTPAYMAPERWRGAAPDPAFDLWALGVILHELLTGRRPLPDAQLGAFAFTPHPLPVPAELTALPGAEVLAACLAVDPAQRPSAEAVVQALSTPDAPTSAGSYRSPYRGLLPFTEADAGDYFGREQETDALAELLRHHGLGLVIGPSGIGKSSFLLAGLARRLGELDRWTPLLLRPGDAPLARLGALLGSPTLAEELRTRPGALVLALRERARTQGAKVLLILDAFEEVFTLASPEEAAQLAECLGAAAAAATDEPWRLVLGVRDDYLGRLARLEPLRRHLGASVVLGPLTAPALRAAIVGPLRRTGFTLDDPTLVERIIQEVSGNPAALPMVQFTCLALWEQRDVTQRRLLASVYQSIGGVAGALASHAHRVLQRLPPEQVRLARALLLRLVTSEGTRQPRPFEAVVEGLGTEAAEVRDFLIAERLLVVFRNPQDEQNLLELAHDSLCQQWPQLVRWLAESREDHALLGELEAAARLWQRRGCRDDETWSGTALGQAVQRVRAGGLQLPDEPRRFLEAGRARASRGTLRRRITWAVAVTLLGLIAASSVAAALEFRSREQAAVRQQHEIRLAAADIGRLKLVLEARDFKPETGEWVPAATSAPLRWTLAPADRDGQGPDYTAPELSLQPLPSEGPGTWSWKVEAPSRAAWLVVERGDCPRSRLRLKRLPGYRERDQPLPVIRVEVPTCQASWVETIAIPGGPFWAPRLKDGGVVDERVELAGFRIDRTEVTNAQFSLFHAHAQLTGHERVEPPTDPEYGLARALRSPVTSVDARTAEDYCAFLGKSLPTLDQWRKAFRGGEFLDADRTQVNPQPMRVALWDEANGVGAANLDGADEFPGPAPVGSFPRDRSPYGVMDLAGNVSEWTSSEATTQRFAGLRQVAGGRWDGAPWRNHWRINWVNNQLTRRLDFAVGIRCVLQMESLSHRSPSHP
ncbi:MAG: SUMF1/EgtB/PvdO family nonheme iron enzyme [Myxococcota bacterium]|nr:SUMF1/EgtB/PvdO family nonheme iron enzyme [Myxococcota bacterium]